MLAQNLNQTFHRRDHVWKNLFFGFNACPKQDTQHFGKLTLSSKRVLAKAKKKVRGSTNGTTVSRVGRSDFFFF